MSFPKLGRDSKGRFVRGFSSRMGVKVSEETKRKISLSHMGKRPGKLNPAWLGGKPKCLDCKKVIGYCSIRCEKCFAKGKLNSNWQGGIDSESHKIRISKEYKLWRTSVFIRDNFICQSCGYDKGKILQAHHILSFTKFPHKRFDISNGITLCVYCHQKIHPEVNLFKGIK